MKRLTIAIALILLSSCANSRGEKSKMVFREFVTPKIEAYHSCMIAYGEARAQVDATPYQIADAAAGSCSEEYAGMEAVLFEHARTSTRGTFTSSAQMQLRNSAQDIKERNRAKVIEIVVTARTPK